jgi:hypothetical protein
MQLEQCTAVEGRGPAVQAQAPAAGPHAQCPKADRLMLADGPVAKLDELIGTRNDFAESVPDDLALAETEQILRGEIQECDAKVLVENHDGDTESAENPIGSRSACGATEAAGPGGSMPAGRRGGTNV